MQNEWSVRHLWVRWRSVAVTLLELYFLLVSNVIEARIIAADEELNVLYIIWSFNCTCECQSSPVAGFIGRHEVDVVMVFVLQLWYCCIYTHQVYMWLFVSGHGWRTTFCILAYRDVMLGMLLCQPVRFQVSCTLWTVCKSPFCSSHSLPTCAYITCILL